MQKLFFAIVLVVSSAILGLLALVAWTSLNLGTAGGALSHYDQVLHDPVAISAAGNTIKFVAWTVFWAILFGATIAWLIERTDIGGNKVVYVLMTLVVLLPGFAKGMGWVFLAHPRIGVLNRALEGIGGSGFVDVMTVTGMGWVQGLSLASVVFIFTSGALRAIDGNLEEAAAISGASRITILRKITLPLVWPAMLGSLIFTTAIALAALDIPLIIGLTNRILVFSTYIYSRSTASTGVPDYGEPAAFGVLLVGAAALLGVLYMRVIRSSNRYQVVSGKAYAMRPARLSGKGKMAARAFVGGYFVLAVFLPLALVAWVAFLPVIEVPSLDAIGRLSLANFKGLNPRLLRTSSKNTAILMVSAGTLAVAVSLAFSWLVLRTRTKLRFAYDFVAFLPQAVPNVLFAFAAYLVVLNMQEPIDLYGSLTIIVLVVALVHLAFGTRMINGSLIQINVELEDAAKMSGATALSTLRYITIPLLAPVLLSSWLWICVLAYRDLTIPTMLASRDNVTLSVAIWSLWSAGQQGASSAITLAMVLVLIPIFALYYWLTTRRRAGIAPAGGGLSM